MGEQSLEHLGSKGRSVTPCLFLALVGELRAPAGVLVPLQ